MKVNNTNAPVCLSFALNVGFNALNIDGVGKLFSPRALNSSWLASLPEASTKDTTSSKMNSRNTLPSGEKKNCNASLTVR